jgi:transcription antitermination factor NusG
MGRDKRMNRSKVAPIMAADTGRISAGQALCDDLSDHGSVNPCAVVNMTGETVRIVQNVDIFTGFQGTIARITQLRRVTAVAITTSAVYQPVLMR